MKLKRIVSAILSLVMVLSSLVISVDAAYADKVNEDGDPIIDYLNQDYATPEEKLAQMIMVREQNGMQLWYEEFTGAGAVKVTASVPGKVFKVNAAVGQALKAGDAIITLEAMKMEIPVVAPQDGTVASIDVAAGDAVENGQVLATMN